MPKGKKRNPRKKKVKGDPNDRLGFYCLLQEHLLFMRERNYSERTVVGRETYLRYFIDWADDRDLNRPNQITKPILERYQRYLYHYRKEDGKALTVRSQHTRLVPVRAFFKWLCRQNYILSNPASELELPRLEKRLPKHILTVNEAEQVLNVPDIDEAIGLRDRAMLEMLYSSGIRRMEVTNLKIEDVDFERGTLMIRQGKNKKDRMIAIGQRALDWLQKYIDESRQQLIIGRDDGTLFISNQGEAFIPSSITHLVRRYVKKADMGKLGSCHLFRHTMATLMLENGADTRFIQHQLGHADLSTTQIYTQVSIRHLKEVHTRTHPANKKH